MDSSDRPEAEISSATDMLIDSVTFRQQEALEVLETAGEALVSGAARAQAEIAGFVSERLRQDMEARQELMRCKSLAEVGGLQARYFRTAVEQYAGETGRLMRLGGEVMARSLARGPD